MTAQGNPIRRFISRYRRLYGVARLMKTMRRVPPGQWRDLRRFRAIARIVRNTMVSGPRLINAYECTRIIEQDGLPGAIVECGVCGGGCVGLMALASRRCGSGGRTLHLFDSFRGLPQPSRHDSDVVDAFRTAHPDIEPDDGCDATRLEPISVCVGPSAEDVRSFLVNELRIDRRRVVIHEGWFQETVPDAAGSVGPIAVLRLDGDLYESTRVCLDHLYENVVRGGFVIIDDYGTFAGCRKAVDEFFARRGEAIELINIDGDGVYLRKTESASPRSTREGGAPADPAAGRPVHHEYRPVCTS
jgi:O-methyltransferase